MIEAELFILGLKVKVAGEFNRADPDVGIMDDYFGCIGVTRCNGLPLEDNFERLCLRVYSDELQAALQKAVETHRDMIDAERADDREYFAYLDC